MRVIANQLRAEREGKGISLTKGTKTASVVPRRLSAMKDNCEHSARP